ncbi:MAG TPA: hypothetical protein VLX44_18895 [Xanthobacteraceae bacterium]|nr:hypothetical protein [Xanthobacteraceae bacterium]
MGRGDPVGDPRLALFVVDHRGDPDELRWQFGPGLLRYRLARADIATSQVVRNSWLNGFGIRMRPGFRLYNVSGLDAVELRLANGDIRLGSDDAEQLAAALKS